MGDWKQDHRTEQELEMPKDLSRMMSPTDQNAIAPTPASMFSEVAAWQWLQCWLGTDLRKEASPDVVWISKLAQSMSCSESLAAVVFIWSSKLVLGVFFMYLRKAICEHILNQ